MGGDVTPFGEGVNLAGAFAQKLMFPGQFADEETGEQITLSHNWHRTYDPTIGRYLQSDPIGLAGGLNRYVYGLNDPVSNIDPDGRIVPLLGLFWLGAALDAAPRMIKNYKSGKPLLECFNPVSAIFSGAMMAFPGFTIARAAGNFKKLRNAQKFRNASRGNRIATYQANTEVLISTSQSLLRNFGINQGLTKLNSKLSPLGDPCKCKNE